MRKFYVCGPMTGLPKSNIPMFDRWTKYLRDGGNEAVSPAELDDPKVREQALTAKGGEKMPLGGTWGDFLARDVKLLADGGITHLLLLPGWQNSRGARLEVFVALLNKLQFFEANENGQYKMPVTRDAVRHILKGNMP